MADRGLLSRLASQARHVDELSSVLEHLRALLNTRRGDSPAAPDFGLMDLTDALHEMPDSIPAIQQSIRNTILAYEPRLRNVSIRLVPSGRPLELSFEVVARLESKSRTLVRMRTRVAPDGRISVDG